jgi:hypothetical protein
MIAFGSVVDSEETFERCASPGLDRVREPDSVLAQYTDAASVGGAYNEILAAVRDRDDL